MIVPYTGESFGPQSRYQSGSFSDEDSLRAFGTSVFGIQTMLRMIRLPKDDLRRQTGTIDAEQWYSRIPPGMLFVVQRTAEIALRQDKLMMNDRGLEAFVHLWNRVIWEYCDFMETT